MQTPHATRDRALRHWFDAARSAASRRWATAPVPMRLFAVGSATMAGAVVLGVVGLPPPFVVSLIIAATAFVAAGFLLDLYAVAMVCLDSRIGKLLGALAGAMVAALSMALASVIVNDATGLDPATFPFAVTFLSPLTAGYVLTLGTVLVTVGYFVWLALASVWGLFTLIPIGGPCLRGPDPDRFVFRMAGVVALVLANAFAADIGGRPYAEMLRWTASRFVFGLEMYGNDPCAGTGERVRRLSDDVVAVGTSKGAEIVFARRGCALSPEEPAAP